MQNLTNAQNVINKPRLNQIGKPEKFSPDVIVGTCYAWCISFKTIFDRPFSDIKLLNLR